MRQVFQQKPWIYPKDPPELQRLYHTYGRAVSYKKGAILKNRGESQKLFHLTEGICMYYANYAEGNPRALSIILPQRTMGDITCITQERVNVTSIVLRDATVLVVPPDILLESMKKDAELATKICRHMLAKQECSLEAIIANATCEPAMRLKILLRAILLEHQDNIGNGWYPLPLTLTHEEYAEIINVTRVTISRILSHWQDENLIRRENRQIIINGALFADIYDWLNFLPTVA